MLSGGYTPPSSARSHRARASSPIAASADSTASRTITGRTPRSTLNAMAEPAAATAATAPPAIRAWPDSCPCSHDQISMPSPTSRPSPVTSSRSRLFHGGLVGSTRPACRSVSSGTATKRMTYATGDQSSANSGMSSVGAASASPMTSSLLGSRVHQPRPSERSRKTASAMAVSTPSAVAQEKSSSTTTSANPYESGASVMLTG
ncbi:hypothetical protein [Nonomuraea sp. KM90]|uniref:hypothetical protein n=1 Tax=Nonomuraea sp. KM90 TaxID=3457428 RepID=UPI003FCC484E